MSLTARYLEEHGIPTVIIGSARDIVEHCAVPRFLFVDFPLGNPCGKPWDTDMQLRITTQGIRLLETATDPMITVMSQESWGTDKWRDQFLAVTTENAEELAQKGEELRARRAQRLRRADG